MIFLTLSAANAFLFFQSSEMWTDPARPALYAMTSETCYWRGSKDKWLQRTSQGAQRDPARVRNDAPEEVHLWRNLSGWGIHTCRCVPLCAADCCCFSFLYFFGNVQVQFFSQIKTPVRRFYTIASPFIILFGLLLDYSDDQSPNQKETHMGRIPSLLFSLDLFNGECTKVHVAFCTS